MVAALVALLTLMAAAPTAAQRAGARHPRTGRHHGGRAVAPRSSSAQRPATSAGSGGAPGPRAPGAASARARTGARRTRPAPPAGMPDGVPPAALRPEPPLPVPAGWPFPEAFPRTSGTGRLAGGALEWTDFLYDDHGAAGVPVRFPVAGLAPSKGTYVYDKGSSANNGADIFRAAIALDATSTWWRVDWNTLDDANIPVAEFAIDRGLGRDGGDGTWPAGAGVRSPGIDTALVVSGRGAWLVDVATGARRAVAALGGTVIVDTKARSFTVRLPRATLAPTGRWKVRLASGVANPAGDGFAPVDRDHGALAGQPAVYNVAFRRYAQEPQSQNFWMEATQAAALAQGDVSAFAVDVSWSDLAARRTAPEPRPTGYLNRWYVSSIELGPGAIPDASGVQDLRPNFLGRVQPYAVYVPSSYDGRHPLPLTWMLHSLGVQHNQYGAIDPVLVQQACEKRRSICATTLGRGPDGWYFDEAELDFWEVWNRLAGAFRLDPDRTVLSGYSMGGWGTYKLGLEYPHLFSKAVVLEGPPLCGLRVLPGFEGRAAQSGPCGSDGDSSPLVGNARWLPYYIGQGVIDELVPATSALDQANRFDAAGERYHLDLWPAADHLAYAEEDGFRSAVEHMDDAPRTRRPGHFSYRWYPDLQRADLGIGPTTVYWLRGLLARDRSPGVLAGIDADSKAQPDPAVTVERHRDAVLPTAELTGDPTSAWKAITDTGVSTELAWVPAPASPVPPARAQVDLGLVDVRAITVELPDAGLPTGAHGAVSVTSDGPVTVGLAGLAPGTRVAVDGRAGAVAGDDGSAAVTLSAGGATLQF